MDISSREEILNDLQRSFETYMNQFNLDDIGIYEEQGQGNTYYIGYTVKKDGRTYHIHTPYHQNEHGGFTSGKKEWTVEPDDPNKEDLSGYDDLESVLRDI
ncbi:hypothetical protein SAMN05192533_10752 [Mesobacillus persicus]|uniref:GK1464-like domain-containing protein n=1 Tax=Mesobacillus persicus TaxID=930146 RepID=A0A1H8CHE9_9BACI|nr:DUF5634 family protein [Mesobacillus persicus]SEM93507.1 hypothetical protein SAMN05192533_10752 [Mesobacillus persicus]